MSFIDKAFIIYMTACILALVFVIAKIKMVKLELTRPEKPAPKRKQRPLIYLAQPFGGLEENAARAKANLLLMVEMHPDKDFISPIIAFGFAYEILSYDKGMQLCEALLLRCDELWIINDHGKSVGVKRERIAAKLNGIPIKEMTLPDATP